jgi:ectoine hydroxylase-related dioxygenase (phytanoyl-CoA dioxygenase family)
MLHQLQFEACATVHELIGSGNALAAVAAATGDRLVCTGATYAHCKPGYAAIPLHTDHDPYDTQPYRPSNPIALRVLHYLDDLTPERAPLRVIPRSHLRLHRRWRYDQRLDRHDEEVTVTCRAGDAVIINARLFHAVGPNLTGSSRRVVAITYRPAWAGPVQPIAEHDPAHLERLPPDLVPLFANLNRRGDATPCG